MRTTIIISLFLCVGAGHYLLNAFPIRDFAYIQLITQAALSCLCLFGAFLLMLQSNGLRLRRICAFQTAMVAVAGLATMAVYLLSPNHTFAISVFSPAVILHGNAFACIFLLYPLELMRPGWLSVRRAALLFLPAAIVVSVYFAILLAQSASVHVLHGWSDLADNIRDFDVWFRFLLLLYPVGLFGLLQHYKKGHVASCSPDDGGRLCLLNNYNVGFALLLMSYLVVAVSSSHQGRMLHGLLFLGFTSYLMYQSLFNLPQSAGKSVAAPCDEKVSEEPVGSPVAERELRCFAGMMPQYKEMLEQWMQTKKPYRDPHFKLLDCMSALPLNRSYLSRLFNEGHNETFFAFVMRHRIEESIRLLCEHPEMTIARVSELCGFSSPSVFGRAFLKHTGQTPLQYRRKHFAEIKAG